MRTRRAALRIALSAAILGGGLSTAAWSQDASVADLAAAPGTDIVEGSADAKVTVIEYASMTCSHCASFHKDTYPELKKRYIDTGKVRFVLRPFPLDNLATAAFMLTQCRGKESYYPFVDLLFSTQADWAFSAKPLDGLIAKSKQAGMDNDKFESCLKDQSLLDGVVASREYAGKTLKVTSTPTFFVNGTRFVGTIDPARLDEILAPLSGGAPATPAAKTPAE